MFRKMHRPLLAIFMLTGFLSAGTALADPISNAPGAECVATGSAHLTVRDDGEAENRTASAVTAICPAERPIGNDDTTSSLGGHVFVVDQSTAGNVCCRAASKNPAGARVTGAWKCSSGASTSYRLLDLPSIVDNYTWSAFYLECQLPPLNNGQASRIQMYRPIQE